MNSVKKWSVPKTVLTFTVNFRTSTCTLCISFVLQGTSKTSSAKLTTYRTPPDEGSNDSSSSLAMIPLVYESDIELTVPKRIPYNRSDLVIPNKFSPPPGFLSSTRPSDSLYTKIQAAHLHRVNTDVHYAREFRIGLSVMDDSTMLTTFAQVSSHLIRFINKLSKSTVTQMNHFPVF